MFLAEALAMHGCRGVIISEAANFAQECRPTASFQRPHPFNIHTSLHDRHFLLIEPLRPNGRNPLSRLALVLAEL